MTLFAFIGVAVTSASAVIFGEAIWDPVKLLSRIESPVAIFIALFALLIATLTTNVAANVVAPANGFANLWPAKITFARGGILTGIIGIAIMPWKLLENADRYIGWLIAYSGFLGPIAGIFIADYWLVRRAQARAGRALPPGRDLRARRTTGRSPPSSRACRRRWWGSWCRRCGRSTTTPGSSASASPFAVVLRADARHAGAGSLGHSPGRGLTSAFEVLT